MTSSVTAALVPSRSFPVSVPRSYEHGGELIVVGHFALRQTIPTSTAIGPARAATVYSEPQRPRLVRTAAPDLSEPPRAAPSAMHSGPFTPTVLPTEESLALRTATAKHRANAYAAMM